MSAHIPAGTLNRQVLEEAAAWFVEMDADDLPARTRQAFDAWLRRSPEHVRAFVELLPLWEGAAETRPGRYPPPEELIARYLKSAPDNIIPFEIHSPGGHPGIRPAASMPVTVSRRASGSRRFGSMAAAAVMCCAVLGWLGYERGLVTTRIGEQRSLTLDDGSAVELNARSRIRVRLTASLREVDLLDGQAIFQVAKDPARPFIVRSGHIQVRALGTQFDVDRGLKTTTVTVLEGRVAVSSGTGAVEPEALPKVELTGGQQLKIAAATLSAPALPKPTSINVAEAGAWTRHRLSFQKSTLAEVAEEFNRYNSRQLHIDSPSLQAYLVSGTFSSTDPASLLRFLRTQAGIEVSESTDSVRITGTNTGPPP